MHKLIIIFNRLSGVRACDEWGRKPLPEFVSFEKHVCISLRFIIKINAWLLKKESLSNKRI